MRNKTVQSWLIAALIAVTCGGYIYAQINSVTGVGQGTDWPPFSADLAKKAVVLKRFNAGLNKTLPTPQPAAGALGGYGWAPYLQVAMTHVISSDSATKGVRLFVGDQGDAITIINSSATAANMFPADGGTINGAAANVGVVIAASKGVYAYCTSPNNWCVFDTAARAAAVATPTASPTATPTASPTATLVPTPTP